MVFPFFFLPFPFSQVIKSDGGGYGELDGAGDEKTHRKKHAVSKFHVLSRDAELNQVQRQKKNRHGVCGGYEKHTANQRIDILFIHWL